MISIQKKKTSDAQYVVRESMEKMGGALTLFPDKHPRLLTVSGKTKKQ